MSWTGTTIADALQLCEHWAHRDLIALDGLYSVTRKERFPDKYGYATNTHIMRGGTYEEE